MARFCGLSVAEENIVFRFCFVFNFYRFSVNFTSCILIPLLSPSLTSAHCPCKLPHKSKPNLKEKLKPNQTKAKQNKTKTNALKAEREESSHRCCALNHTVKFIHLYLLAFMALSGSRPLASALPPIITCYNSS